MTVANNMNYSKQETLNLKAMEFINDFEYVMKLKIEEKKTLMN